MGLMRPNEMAMGGKKRGTLAGMGGAVFAEYDAVTGLENVAHAGALVPLSLVLLCDWPMMRAMLKDYMLLHNAD